MDFAPVQPWLSSHGFVFIRDGCAVLCDMCNAHLGVADRVLGLLIESLAAMGLKATAEGVLLKEMEMSHIGKLQSELQCVCSAIY